MVADFLSRFWRFLLVLSFSPSWSLIKNSAKELTNSDPKLASLLSFFCFQVSLTSVSFLLHQRLCWTEENLSLRNLRDCWAPTSPPSSSTLCQSHPCKRWIFVRSYNGQLSVIFRYDKVVVNLKHLCFFSVKINISTTGGFRVGFFQPDTNHP